MSSSRVLRVEGKIVARVLTVLVGEVLDLPADGVGGWIDRPWRTAIFKRPVAGPVWFDPLGAAGDHHADLTRHGGEEKAVLAFSQSAYRALQAGGLEVASPGAFGENLLLDGLDEVSACIGDLLAVGGASLRVVQPRQPAWKIARRWHDTRLPKRLAAAGWTGWYCRVTEPGFIAPGAEVTLLERPHPEISIRRAVEVLYSRHRDVRAAQSLAACQFLGSTWRDKLDVRFGLSDAGRRQAKSRP